MRLIPIHLKAFISYICLTIQTDIWLYEKIFVNRCSISENWTVC